MFSISLYSLFHIPSSKLYLCFMVLFDALNRVGPDAERLRAALSALGYVTWLDSGGYGTSQRFHHHTWDVLAGVGIRQLFVPGDDFFASLDAFVRHRWVMGYLGYDLKNRLEPLESVHSSPVDFPEYFLYEPALVFGLRHGQWYYQVAPGSEWYAEQVVYAATATEKKAAESFPVNIAPGMYRQKIETLLRHIQRGDIYEVNYCHAFSGQHFFPDPARLYSQLVSENPSPFSAYMAMDTHHILSASPERFLARRANRLISQPIKGTAPRGRTEEEDRRYVQFLETSQKERSENIMIVDLVRNDLSRVCVPGSVVVDELCGIYPFPSVHQVISTVSGEIRENTGFADILRALFPMGSMTGAPKIRAMQLIEEYEEFRRGPFSGAIGYMAPSGDFDWNVVIRSLLIDNRRGTWMYPVGSAITAYCHPEDEWNECLLKAKPLFSMAGKTL